MRRHARVGNGADARAPAESLPQPFDSGVRRAVGEMRGVSVPAIRVQTPHAEIAARDKHRPARAAPALARNRVGQRANGGEPIGWCGLANTAGARAREWDVLSATGAGDGGASARSL